MAEAIAKAIRSERHVVVQAGTGTGKTLAYLVPAIVSGQRVVVATATKTLQDQLAAKDLPFLAEHLGVEFHWEVLKGRSNYLCMQRVREVAAAPDGQLELETTAASVRSEVQRLVAWSATATSGDQAELDWVPSHEAWRTVSVGSDECPGRHQCPMGERCFAEAARQRADTAQVVVVNIHLYGLDVAADGAIIGEHGLVIVDEAHQLEDIISDTAAIEIGAGRLIRVAAIARRIIDDPAMIARVTDGATVLTQVLSPAHGARLPWPLPDELQATLTDLRARVDALNTAANRAKEASKPDTDPFQRAIRLQKAAGWLIGSIDLALAHPDQFVPFVGGPPQAPRLEIAPLDVAPVLRAGVWDKRPAVLTSATIPSSLRARLGLDDAEAVDVGSPFDYAANALLYCALHLPDPRAASFAAASHDELVQLIRAAGGRTMALFTSWKAMDAAAAAVRDRVDVPVLTQRDMPKNALIRSFAADEATCLFATAGFFQGVDVPGRTLSLVVIDRIPFPRPNDPLLSARRELLGSRAFAEIDVPRASMLLAQATGRLIRTATDRGVVAVLDRRLGTANYRWDIVGALPPMRRTRERATAVEFLRQIAAQ